MKRQYYIGVIALAVVLLVGALAMSPLAQSTITWEGVLPQIFTGTSGTEGLNIAMIASTVGLAGSEETALTNTVNPTLELTHTTSGTPANNIGVGIDFYQETSAANTENVMSLNAVITDATAGSEDAKFSLELMAAGAASAEKFSVGSTGIVTLSGGATLDNATSATNLAIAETNIGLTGIVTMTGATTVTGALTQTGAVTQDGGVVTINEAGADYDFRVESDNVTDALKVDAGTNTVLHGAWSAYEIVTAAQQSYSVTSASRAHIIEVDYTTTEAATVHLMTELLTSPGAGTVLWITDKDGNGDTNNIVVDTEGAEKINGADTYTIDADYGALQLYTDGTHWFVLKASQ